MKDFEPVRDSSGLYSDSDSESGETLPTGRLKVIAYSRVNFGNVIFVNS